ncbi:ABC transporter substrate-binding protein [Desulfobacterales bacterium HSG17]|nr:ABC transporter substrate-binding protein [Desulfobacterales bacterium HSG17]
MNRFRFIIIASIVSVFLLFHVPAGQADSDAILIGLDADMSSGSAKSGEAIRRGIILAIDEINKAGGVLGRSFELVVKDHRGNPARGIDNIEDFSGMKDLVAVVGGLHTPVAMAELEKIHERKLVYLVPWAAGTPVIKNGFTPNYAFRVSVRDEYAGGFLVDQAIGVGYKRLGLLLEQTGWGRSNKNAMEAALKNKGLEPAGIQWFLWGVNSLADQISSLRSAGAEAILMVANAPEGIVAVRSMASMPGEYRLPIISHWGITGGDFFQKAQKELSRVNLVFLQTYSFIDPPFPDRAKHFMDMLKKKYPDIQSPRDIFSPVGTAHAYDLIQLLKSAVEKAGTIERPAVRTALENLEEYKGLVRDYKPPFTSENHDALNRDDFRIAGYDSEGVIIPVKRNK